MRVNKFAVRVVVSYAKEDQDLLDELKKHLSPLKRNGYIDTWDDRDILAGAEWSIEMDTRLKTAHIILLLISPDFIASDYSYSIEVEQALKRHEKGDAYVVPIILRPVQWKEMLFGKLRSLPSGDRPIRSSKWQYADEAFADVVRGISKVVEEVKTKLLKSEHMMKIFICYSSKNKDSVYNLAEKLTNDAGYYVWLDRELSGNQLWWDNILDQVEEYDCFMPVLTPQFMRSPSCISLLQYALALKKSILPLILASCDIPQALSSLACTDITNLSLNEAFLRTTHALANVETDLLQRGYQAQVNVDRPPIPVAIETNSKRATNSFANNIRELQNATTIPAPDSQAQVQVEIQGTIETPADKISEVATPEHQARPKTIIGNDGKSMQLIPASEFICGDQLLDLPDFYIDTWPVTNKEYQRFLMEENVAPPITWRGGNFPAKKTDHPVAGVSWHEATAYASWAGKRLPTSVEWEKAARGLHGQRYPWGEIFDVQHCNSLESKSKGTVPVTQHRSGVSVFGVLDMAGNVWEWTTNEIKPRGLAWQVQETKRMLKGGSWNTFKGSTECASSTSVWPHEHFPDIGFRCVLSVGI
jgi:hypothetical protein